LGTIIETLEVLEKELEDENNTDFYYHASW